MKVLLTGGAKNGKSHIAQELCSLHSKRFYIATMIPHDEEDLERIRKHVLDRKDQGFETIECGTDILSVVDKIKQEGDDCCVLLDSITALLSNEMFAKDSIYYDAADKVACDLISFSRQIDNLVFVSDGIYNDSFFYDEITEQYRKGLALCEKELGKVCDCVIEMVCGVPIVHKGKLDMNKSENNLVNKGHLIIGGAHQGKLSYAISEFNLLENDICFCAKESFPDFSKKCIVNIENYVWFCLKNNLPCSFDFINENSVIIASDIFCGVVPMDSFERKWREESGIFLQEISRHSSVTRIICGIPQKLK